MWQAHEFMRRVGKALRTHNDDFSKEPLPERWVDLICYLDEKERQQSAGQQPEAEQQFRRPRQTNRICDAHFVALDASLASASAASFSYASAMSSIVFLSAGSSS